MYQYTYLLMAILFLIVWILIFSLRRNLRREMIFTSIVGMIAGPFTEIAYTRDWWTPITITGTRIGPESILCGFALGGLSAVMYKFAFKKNTERSDLQLNWRALIFFSPLVLILIFYFLLKNSLMATILCVLIPIIFMCIYRKDLIVPAILSGIFLLITAVVVYNILNIFTPGWISAFWQFKNVPQIVFLNFPVDDVIWYLCSGAFLSIVYPYWTGKKIVKDYKK